LVNLMRGMEAVLSGGVAPHVADKILNHQTGTISGVAAVYQRHERVGDLYCPTFGAEPVRWGDQQAAAPRIGEGMERQKHPRYHKARRG
jgi:hypothetical protein